MTTEWYKRKGYRKNPLHIEPNFKDFFFGYDVLLEEVFSRIDSGNLVFLEGNTGKTAFLLKIIEKYKGKGKVAYVDCEKVKDELDIKKVIGNGRKSLSRYLTEFPRNMIILLDNVNYLSELNAEKIKYYFDSGNILSLVMTSNSYISTNIPDSLKHRIGNRVYNLRDLTKDEMADIIMERLEFPDFLKEEHIIMLAENTQNIKELIKECASALFVMANQGRDEVTLDIIQKICNTGKKNDMVQ
jgi:hypothetical protein